MTALVLAMVLTTGANFFIGLATLIVLIRKNGHSAGAKDPAWWVSEHDKSVRRGVRLLMQSLEQVRKRVGLGPFVPVTDEEDT